MFFKVGHSRLRQFSPSLNFSHHCSKKYNHLVLWCLLKNQADLKTNCTRLWNYVLMITYNMLTQKYYFCYHLRVFSNSVQLLANELKRYITTWCQLLKLEKPFLLFVMSKTQTERFSDQWQIENFGALFGWK